MNGEGKNEAFEETTKQRQEEEQAQKENEHALKYSYNAQFLKMIDLEIDEAEYMSVVSGINKIYDTNKNKKKIKYHTMDYIYKGRNSL